MTQADLFDQTRAVSFLEFPRLGPQENECYDKNVVVCI